MNPLSLIGRWFGGGAAFSETLEESIDRANVRFILPHDSVGYMTDRSRTGINEKVEWLWQNFGVVKEGGAGMARHTVGKGISLEINSLDEDFNAAAEDDFEDYATTPERCDLAGRRNFYEAQTTGIEQRIFRGEFFAAKTENPEWDGLPCFQLYDSQEIASPGVAPAGSLIYDGCELNQNTRVTAYYAKDFGGEYQRIPRERMIHWFKPHAVNQVRGVSDLAQSVNRLVDIHSLIRLTTRSAQAQQLIALVLKNVEKKKTKGAFGAIKGAPTAATNGEPDPMSAQLEKLVGAAGAGIAYVGENGDAKLLTPNSPTPLVEGFITDLLMRDVCAGWGVPAEFFWSIAKLGGANTRFVLSKADLLFQILADGLNYRFCTPIAYRFIKHRIEKGIIPVPKDKDWARKISWQTPPRVTVDNGKDAAMLIELLANGMITLREYSNARGLNYRHVMRQWIREPIEFLSMAKKELSESKDLSPEQQDGILQRWAANLPLWRAAKPGAAANAPADPQHTDTNADPNADQNAAA